MRKLFKTIRKKIHDHYKLKKEFEHFSKPISSEILTDQEIKEIRIKFKDNAGINRILDCIKNKI